MIRRTLACLALFGLVAAGAALPAQARDGRTRIVRAPGTKAPRLVVPPREAPRHGSAAAVSRSHLAAHRSLYHLDPEDLRVLDVIDAAGGDTVRFGQVHEGVPVFGAQYLVHLADDGDGSSVSSVNGHVFTELDPPRSPRLSEEEAAQVIRHRVRPVVVEDVVSNGLTIVPLGKGALAYDFTVSGHSFGMPVKRRVFINAVTGGVTLNFGELRFDGPVVGSGRTSHGADVPLNVFQRGSSFELRDRGRPMFAAAGGEIKTHDVSGQAVYDPTDANLARSASSVFTGIHTSSGAVDAHWGAGQVYDYYLALGRDSIDGRGGTITSIVNAGDDRTGGPLYNAFWDGEKMIYGNPDPSQLHPLSADLDVVGHELTHGVTQSSASLVYLNQSGALDEAYADYFGQAIDLNNFPNVPPEQDGYVGEDLCKVPEPDEWECPLRDLNDGRTTADYLYYLSDFDGGGVHDNATIYSGALWDIRQQLGGAKTDPIVLKALTEFTTPLDEFIDGRASTVEAARALGSPAEEIALIESIFDAKGIRAGWDQPPQSTDRTLVAGIFQSTADYAPPRISGSRFVIANHADKAKVDREPMQIYVGSVDGSGSLTKVGQDTNPRTFNDEAPDISGSKVVWTHVTASSNGLDADVSSRKLGGAVRTVASGPAWQWYPAVDGKTIVWEQARTNSDIWMRRGSGDPVRVAGGPAEQWLPQVSGDWVAWWLPGDGSSRMAIGMKNVVTGKTATVRAPSARSFLGPPAVGPGYVAWYQDSDSDGLGSIMKVKLGRTAPTALVPEDSELSPVWVGGRLTGMASGPALSAGADFVAYTDERALAAKFVERSPIPSSSVGRDVWLIAVDGGTPQLLTAARGDQGFPAMGAGSLVLWFDGRAARTDLLVNR